MVSSRQRPANSVALWLLASAIIVLTACKNWLEPCATELVVRPSRDSVLLGRSRTLQALVIGGCGLVPTGPAVRAVWHSENPAIAQVSLPTPDAQVTVTGLSRGGATIVASSADLTGRAYILVR